MKRSKEIQRYITAKQLDDKYAPFFADENTVDNAVTAYLSVKEDFQYDEIARRLIAAIKRMNQDNDGLTIQV